MLYAMRRRLYFCCLSGKRRTPRTTCSSRASRTATCTFSPGAHDLGELHEASYLFKTDLPAWRRHRPHARRHRRPASRRGHVAYPPEARSRTVAVLIAAIVAAFWGRGWQAWAAAAVPQSRLKAFHEDIERGQGVAPWSTSLRPHRADP